MSGPLPLVVGDEYTGHAVRADVAIHLEPDAAIRVALPYTAGELAIPYAVRLGANVMVLADRAQVAHLRDVLTAALDATEDGDTE